MSRIHEQIAEQLKADRVKLVALPSVRDVDSDMPYPTIALRVWDKLFNEIVDRIPPIDLWIPDKGCPFCGAEDDHLVYEPAGGEMWLFCNACGQILEHTPDSKQKPKAFTALRGVVYTPDEMLLRAVRYSQDCCPDCGSADCDC